MISDLAVLVGVMAELDSLLVESLGSRETSIGLVVATSMTLATMGVAFSILLRPIDTSGISSSLSGSEATVAFSSECLSFVSLIAVVVLSCTLLDISGLSVETETLTI